MNLKTKWIVSLACFAAAVLAAAVAINMLTPKPVLDDEEYKIKVQQLLDEALQVFKEIRGVSLEKVEIEVIDISWAKENWGKAYAEADKERVLREERIYKALFMIPEDASLYEANVEWWGMIVSAVWQSKIYVVKEYFNPLDKFNAIKTLIHELTHILQAQHPLSTMPTYDGEKAKSALIEGDARLMEEAYENKTREHASMSDVAATRSSKIMYYVDTPSGDVAAKLPDSILSLNYFPYDYGLRFIKALHAENGWDAVNSAYENPPTTTEQIIHPERYFANETGKEADAPTITKESWQTIKNERFGEHFILVMLKNWIPAGQAEKTAEGWGGDNFTYYEKGEDYLLTWNITWDSPEDAREFCQSFQEMMRSAGAAKEAENLWRKHGRRLSLTWEGASTLIVVSTNENAVEEFTR